MLIVLAVLLELLLEEVGDFLVDFLLYLCDKGVEIVEIFLGEFSFVQVDGVCKVLGGLGKERVELCKALVHL